LRRGKTIPLVIVGEKLVLDEPESGWFLEVSQVGGIQPSLSKKITSR
jgi:hypothetical protein